MASSSDVYMAVWNQATSRGAYVHYDRSLHDGRCGLFHPNEDVEPPEPKIHISGVPGGGGPRPGAPFRTGTTPRLNGMTETEIVTELCVLTHEVGHFLSWLSSRTGDNEARAANFEMRAALVRRDEIFSALEKAMPEAPEDEFRRLVNTKLQLELTDAQRRLIIKEEKRAWTLGRELLVQLGLTELEAYETAREVKLRTYREELGDVD